jgi:hypothetical protein
MSTTPVRGHSSKHDTATRKPTTLIRSTTSTRRVGSTRSTPTSSSTSTRSTSTRSPSRSTPTPSGLVRIEVASSSQNSAPTPTPTTIPIGLDTTCSQNIDCTGGKICVSGSCASDPQSNLFDGAGSRGTSHLNTGSAIGIVAVILALALIIFGVGFWCVRGRQRRQTRASTRAAPADVERQASARTKRTLGRSASAATGWTVDNDQKTLVASLPNSPQYAGFAYSLQQQPEYYRPIGKLDEIVEKSEPALSTRGVSRNPTTATRTSADKALPAPPAQEMTYSLNVRINKSMIFEDSLFTPSAPQTPRSRGPRYRFEEVLPPVPGSNPQISVTQPKLATLASQAAEYEMHNYAKSKHSSVFSDITMRSRGSTQYGQAQVRDLRGSTLRRLEGELPALPAQTYYHTQAFDTRPSSASYSFRSYDWYPDILDPDSPPILTPDLSSNGHAAGVNPLSSHPFHHASVRKPSPLTLAPNSQTTNHLHPNSASGMDSPTSSGYHLSPTVYRMPSRSRTPQIVPTPPSTRPSSSSTMSSFHSANPRFTSWQPNDDNMIPEDDLPLPRYSRKKSMAASLVMACETPAQTPSHTRHGSKATIKSRKSWLPKVGLPAAADDSFAKFKREYLSRRESYATLQ